MNKQQAESYIRQHLDPNDELIGFFQAMSPPNFWWFFLIGPLCVLSMKVYFIAVTRKGVSFHQLSMMGKFKQHDFFAFDEISTVKIGKGIIRRPIKFTFHNLRTLKIKAQLKGVEKVAKLRPEVQQQLMDNIDVQQ